ncbi:hypothetical protein GCM10022224_055920 [Nonomuraea antimicrobica]|uniref:Uncharacterized protein n=1 Tax=Nonomuraea antimicrobica TaxID=561173 RepID=A0ABP7CD99_9ACTN
MFFMAVIAFRAADIASRAGHRVGALNSSPSPERMQWVTQTRRRSASRRAESADGMKRSRRSRDDPADLDNAFERAQARIAADHGLIALA